MRGGLSHRGNGGRQPLRRCCWEAGSVKTPWLLLSLLARLLPVSSKVPFVWKPSSKGNWGNIVARTQCRAREGRAGDWGKQTTNSSAPF